MYKPHSVKYPNIHINKYQCKNCGLLHKKEWFSYTFPGFGKKPAKGIVKTGHFRLLPDSRSLLLFTLWVAFKNELSGDLTTK